MIARLRRGLENDAGARAQESIARRLAEDSLLPVRGDHRSESTYLNGEHSRIWSMPALELGYSFSSELRFLRAGGQRQPQQGHEYLEESKKHPGIIPDSILFRQDVARNDR